MSFWKRVVITLAVVGLLVGLAPASEAARRGRPRTVSLVGARLDDNGWFFYPQSCGPAQPGLCTFRASGIVRWSGVIDGISEFQTYLRWDSNKQKVVEEVWEDFRAVTIAGCGTGSFLAYHYKEFTLAEIVLLQKPTTGKLQGGNGTWNYVPGTATGDLANMRSLSFTFDQIQFELGTFENHHTVDRGTAVC